MFLAINENTEFVLLIFAFLITLFLTIFLASRVKRERIRYKEEKSIILDGLLSKTAMSATINTYLSKIEQGESFSLLYVDIDKVGEISNAFGKKDTDRSLERVAYRMVKDIPRRAVISSFSSTRYLILMKSEYDRFRCLDLAKDLLEVVKKPIKIYKDTSINFTCSIGICFYPLHGKKLKQLLTSLEIALTNAQKNGGDNFVTYSSNTNEAKSESVEYHYELKEAMANKEFVLYYQPIINIRENSIYGVEALVRWNHPKNGVLSPIQFINIMEQSGDIDWIGTWGIESLVKEYFELRREFSSRDIRFTLNLSPKQLMNDQLAINFNKIIKRYKMPADFIALEISDFSYYESNATIKQTIQKLKKVGFKICINGFGLEYNTLSTLDKMPIDIIKLDKQFYEGEKESYMKDKLSDLIVEFANNNNKLIIYEGIETEEMLTVVKKSNINLVQGYIYSKPILSMELMDYIKNEEWTKKTVN